ncbi:MAG: hypothetical protein ACRDWT_16080 [Jatrophihabitantaceae bacterium]
MAVTATVLSLANPPARTEHSPPAGAISTTFTTLPDGVRLAVTTIRRGGMLAVVAVDALRPDGSMISLTETAPGAAAPALTLDQLTAIATSSRWQVRVRQASEVPK